MEGAAHGSIPLAAANRREMDVWRFKSCTHLVSFSLTLALTKPACCYCIHYRPTCRNRWGGGIGAFATAPQIVLILGTVI